MQNSIKLIEEYYINEQNVRDQGYLIIYYLQGRQRNNATWYDLLEKHNNSFELAAEHSTTIGSKVQRRYSRRIENSIPEEMLFY